MADDLTELMNTRRWCYYIPDNGFVPGKGYRVSVVIEGEWGHFPTGDLNWKASNHVEPWFWGTTYKEAEEFCAEQNQRLGIDVVEVWKIVCSSTVKQAPGRKPQKGIP